ncbi:MAG: hypothetical protein BWX61_00036 [Bacteroidetes bacterium ADurb.Bin035]|nr:MAG: hypothetical protein BWX61_00036 [Bacteroidetes bacterium ADurb.Bin035]
MRVPSDILTNVLLTNFISIKDNTDQIRCHILCMTIVRLKKENNLSIESIKATSAYASFQYDVGCDDEFLQKLIDEANTFELCN